MIYPQARTIFLKEDPAMRKTMTSPTRSGYKIPPTLRFLAIALPLIALVVPLSLTGQSPDANEIPLVREIYVSLEDFDAIMEGQSNRVLLPREEYDALLTAARQAPEDPESPVPFVVAAADYDIVIEGRRARIEGRLAIDVLTDDPVAVPVPLTGTGLIAANVDGVAAPIGKADAAPDGPHHLFLQGEGRRELQLQLLMPLMTTTTQQELHFRLPPAPSGRVLLTVPGDVELKSGAAVAERTVEHPEDDEADVAANRTTRFELLPNAAAAYDLILTLNSHTQRQNRTVLAGCVILDELTETYERLHATITLDIPHRPVDEFRFEIPEGFEVTGVTTPDLARWAIEDPASTSEALEASEEEIGEVSEDTEILSESATSSAKILSVKLRQEATGQVTLNLQATKTPPSLDDWTMPRLTPLDAVGHTAVLGLLLDRRLAATGIVSEDLVSIDTEVLTNAFPDSLNSSDPSDPLIRSVAAWYAPEASNYSVSASVVKPEAQLAVTTNVLLTLEESRLLARGGFVLSPTYEKVFDVNFTVPEGWHVSHIRAEDGSELSFEIRDEGTAHVRLPRGAVPGQLTRVMFEAVAAPEGWLGEWESQTIEFPIFQIAEATDDVGVVAVRAGRDMTVRPDPDQVRKLAPVDENLRGDYLDGMDADLAYRFSEPDYLLHFDAVRTNPRLTAQTFTFAKVESDSLNMSYQIDFTVEEARTRELSFELPAETPTQLSVYGLDGVRVKEYSIDAGEDTDPSENVSEGSELRRWNIRLNESHIGLIRLIVTCPMPLQIDTEASLTVPVIRAADVAWQSGLIAVEGHESFDINTTPGENTRRVDVGELAIASYTPNRRLLGAFGFVGAEGRLEMEVVRHPAYELIPTIVERAALHTRLSTNGTVQTSAVYEFRTKAAYFDVTLPEEAELWTVTLGGEPVKPQRNGDRVLISLPSGDDRAVHLLELLYKQTVSEFGLTGRIATRGPTLAYRPVPNADPITIPVADLEWRVSPPPGYQLFRSGGTVTLQAAKEESSVLDAVRTLGVCLFPAPQGCRIGCGVRDHSRRAAPSYSLSKPEDSAPMSSYQLDDSGYGHEGGYGDDYGMDADFEPYDEESEESGYRSMRESDVMLEEESLADPQDAAETPPAEPSAPPTARPADPVGGPESPESGVNDRFDGRRYDAYAEGRETVTRSPAFQSDYIEGARSLGIQLEVDPAGEADILTLTSLGEEPFLELTFADDTIFDSLTWLAYALVGLTGLRLTRCKSKSKAKYVVYVLLFSAMTPLIPGLERLEPIAVAAAQAAVHLVPFYLIAGLIRSFLKNVKVETSEHSRVPAEKAATLLLIALLTMSLITGFTAPSHLTSLANAQDPAVAVVDSAAELSALQVDGMRIEVVPPPGPISVPDDAVLIPFDPANPSILDEQSEQDRLLIPYVKYVELWNLAYPDEKIETEPGVPPQASYALAGAEYSAVLREADALRIEGVILIDLMVDSPVLVPFETGGVVITSATLDDQPARLNILDSTPPTDQPQQQPSPVANSTQRQAAALLIEGEGRHTLRFVVQAPLTRQGGWRVANAVLPYAPANRVLLTTPEPDTDLSLPDSPDHLKHETTEPNESIDTTLAPSGLLHIEWRPQVAKGEVDQSLTAASRAILDVRENGLRLAWEVRLDFRNGQRESFEFQVPTEYLVESVEGGNVRGWETAEEDDGTGRKTIEVELLKAAELQETFLLRLLRCDAVGTSLTDFTMPMVRVVGASLHGGEMTIRRSQLLDVRATAVSGVARTDIANETIAQLVGTTEATENPFDCNPLQAFSFNQENYRVNITASPIECDMRAAVQYVIRMAEFERVLDARILLSARNRPVYQVEIVLPEELEIEPPQAPGAFDWTESRRDDQRLLTITSQSGFEGSVSILVKGALPCDDPLAPLTLPKLEVLGAGYPTHEFAIQTDPAYEVRSEALLNCSPRLLGQLHWLTPENESQTQFGIQAQSHVFSGMILIEARTPDVRCETITNVRVTDRAVEETIMLDFTINKAGIQNLSFLLPSWMGDSRFEAPSVRQRTIEPIDDSENAPLRVSLELHDEQMNQYRVLIRNDRLLVPGQKYEAPIPVVETGTTQRRYIVLENADGRDEIIVGEGSTEGLESLTRQHPEWALLTSVLGDRLTKAYLIDESARVAPRLTFKTEQRDVIEITDASIGLSETTLVLDENGAYRAEQVYFITNRSEQFMDVRLPDDAVLWTARLFTAPQWTAKQKGVAGSGEALKPTETPGAEGDPTRVRIPLIKTEVGDLDYVVRIQYGGRMERPGSFQKLHFPLMKVLDIHVEQSTVQLHLPETYRYGMFGGTLNQAEPDRLTEARRAYASKQEERIAYAIERGNDFEQARAYNNVTFANDFLNTILPEDEAGDQLAMSSEDFAGGEEPPPVPDELLMLDNRRQLEGWYEGQRNDRSKNVVSDLGRNWDVAEIDRQTAQQEQQSLRFNTGWLEGNQLLNEEQTAMGGSNPDQPGGNDMGGKAISSRLSGPETGLAGELARGERIGSQSSFGYLALEDGEAPASGPETAQPQRRDSVAEYQERHRMQQQAEQSYGNLTLDQPLAGNEAYSRNNAGQGIATANGMITAGEPQEMGGYDSRSGQAGGFGGGMGGMGMGMGGGGYANQAGDYGVPQSVQANAPIDASHVPIPNELPILYPSNTEFAAMTGGTMSLDVEFPERGTVLLFTTPRGELELTAVAVSEELVEDGTSAGKVIGLMLLALIMIHLISKLILRIEGSKPFALTLLVATLPLLCTYPGLAILSLGFGLVILFNRSAKANEEQVAEESV
jgi:hypothetical protein